MAKLFELKQQRKFALDKAEAIIAASESAKVELTPNQSAEVDYCMTAVHALNTQITSIEKTATIRGMMSPNGTLLTDGPRTAQRGPEGIQLSEDYPTAFHDYISSAGKRLDAALYEGSNSAGGFAVPIVVDNQIVPLAPQEMAIRQLATVIPTTSDIKIPTKASFSVAAAKAELDSFGGTAPTLGQLTLSAFMAGEALDTSWELAQDVPVFQQFLVDDMVTAQQLFEEAWYMSGTGTGQPQGLIGNVGAGITAEPDSSGNLVTIAGTLDMLGKLNAVYHKGASWLMSRPTSILIRKAQVAANLFEPVWTRTGTQDFLHGYPVAYSQFAPVAARGNTPVMFGDFKRGYVIGDRGGSGINVKVLDQPKAAQGILTLLTYRRTDGRVRLSEAIQGYTIAAS